MIYTRGQVDGAVEAAIKACNEEWVRMIGPNTWHDFDTCESNAESEAKDAANKLIDAYPEPEVEFTFRIIGEKKRIVLTEGPSNG